MLRNFSYVIDQALAGSARPGLWGSLMDDLVEARKHGVTHIISLTERPLGRAVVEEAGFKILHVPVVDFSPPTIDQLEEIVSYVDKARADKGVVLIHCQAGMGRTGTALAAYLVSQGIPASEAIEKIRDMRSGSIETSDQEEIVFEFQHYLKQKEANEKAPNGEKGSGR